MKTSLTSMAKKKLGHFFNVSNRSQASLLLVDNLLVAGLIPKDVILARVRAETSRERWKRMDEASASAQATQQ